MDERSPPGTDAEVRAWLRGPSAGEATANVAAPAVGRVVEFVLEQPIDALEPIVRAAAVPCEPPSPRAPERSALDVANRAVALSFARFRLGSPERPGWPGFGSRGPEQRALVSWAEVTATRAPGFAEHLLAVIVEPKRPALVRHARIVVLAATGRVEQARHEAITLAQDWLSGASARELPATEVEQLLSRLPPDDEIADLRERLRVAQPHRTRSKRPGK